MVPKHILHCNYDLPSATIIISVLCITFLGASLMLISLSITSINKIHSNVLITLTGLKSVLTEKPSDIRSYNYSSFHLHVPVFPYPRFCFWSSHPSVAISQWHPDIWDAMCAKSASHMHILIFTKLAVALKVWIPKRRKKITDSWECGREHNLRFRWRCHQPFSSCQSNTHVGRSFVRLLDYS